MKNLLPRRTFLRNAAVTGTAVFIPGGVSYASRSLTDDSFKLNISPLKLGVMTYNIAKDWDIDTIIGNLKATGYQSVELRTTHKHGVEVTLNARERAEVKKRFADSPLEAISLASAFSYHYPEPDQLKKSIEGTKEYILLARDVGAIGIRVFPNELPDSVPVEKTLEQIGKALAEVGEFGYNHGVEIRVCNHGKGTNRIPVISRIFDYSQSSHVYLNWNCDLTDIEGEGFEYNFSMVKNRIRGLHMHELWDEQYPYRKLFSLLSELNFTGFCNAEIEGNDDPIRLLRYYRGLFLALQNAV
jgi:sugar phosphate isomerase/epimerase